jgi:hypothetical protein
VATRAESEGRETRELGRDEWSPFFEDINKRLEGGFEIEATIEIVGEDFVGPEAERLPLDSITYERGDDEIAIGLGGRSRRFPAVLWHFAAHPRRLWVLERENELDAIAIESEDGTRTLLYLHQG